MIVNAIKTNIVNFYKVDNKKTKQLSYSKINFKANNNLESKIAYNNSIHGFSNEKEIFYNEFLAPIASNNLYSNTQPSVALSSTDKIVTKMFENGIRSFASTNNLHFAKIPTNNTPEDLIKAINYHLDANAKYFNDSNKRSIILIEQPEKFIGFDASETHLLEGMNLRKSDYSIINENNCFSTINYFKSVLDFCNKIPEYTKNGKATTFIFLTQNPHLIHSEIRDGKMEKFHIDFPKANDIDQIIKSYLNNYWNLQIDSEDIEKISPLLAQYFEIKDWQQGGYSIDTVLRIVDNVLENTNNYDSQHLCLEFIKTIKNTPFDIAKRDIKHYINIKNNISQTFDEFEKFSQLEENGMLDKESLIEFKKLIGKELAQIKILKEKRKQKIITHSENELLKKLVKRYKSVL